MMIHAASCRLGLLKTQWAMYNPSLIIMEIRAGLSMHFSFKISTAKYVNHFLHRIFVDQKQM